MVSFHMPCVVALALTVALTSNHVEGKKGQDDNMKKLDEAKVAYSIFLQRNVFINGAPGPSVEEIECKFKRKKTIECEASCGPATDKTVKATAKRITNNSRNRWDFNNGALAAEQCPEGTTTTTNATTTTSTTTVVIDYVKAAGILCGAGKSVACGPDNTLFLGSVNKLKATPISDRDDTAGCAQICDAELNCGGFNVKNTTASVDGWHCLYRASTRCSVAVVESRDCYTRIPYGTGGLVCQAS